VSFGIDAFEAPGIGLALVALAALVLAMRRRPAALAWPALAEARAAGARPVDLVRIAALGLRAVALVAAGLVLARPVARVDAAPREVPGLDLVLALDASASMRALDVSRNGETRTRFELAGEVVARFAQERAAEGDRVALVLFGERAFTQVPLTRDGALLAAALRRVEPGIAGEATALGDALVLATRRALGATLVTEPSDAAATGGRARGAGRLVVLLTDGRSNAGAVPVDIAAEVAADAGVRVHTVGIGGTGEVPVLKGPRGVRFERHDLDEAALRRIADATGGRAFLARRSSDLESVYAEIAGLERIARPATPPPASRAYATPLLALAAGGVLAELLLARALGRRLP
jgi:Ca-activated chloride channel family protein